ncbi:hypothetical protein, partial [Flavobacterium oreochromis]
LADVTARNSLKEYFASIRARIPSEAAVAQMLAKLKNSAAWARYEALSPAMKKIFNADFGNVSDEVIEVLKKEESAFNAWKKYRETYTNRVICN